MITFEVKLALICFGEMVGFVNSLMWVYLFSAVYPVAPVNLSAVVHAWNATVRWQWEYSSYSSFALVCETELTSSGYKTMVSN